MLDVEINFDYKPNNDLIDKKFQLTEAFTTIDPDSPTSQPFQVFYKDDRTTLEFLNTESSLYLGLTFATGSEDEAEDADELIRSLVNMTRDRSNRYKVVISRVPYENEAKLKKYNKELRFDFYKYDEDAQHWMGEYINNLDAHKEISATYIIFGTFEFYYNEIVKKDSSGYYTDE